MSTCANDARQLCFTVARVSPTAPGTTDAMNPDATLRDRPLCGLRIGDGFKPDSPTTASGGQIYDPMSGKTYSAKMESKGDTLKLRGYIGVPTLGRTETWTRTATPPPCS
ncbi:hypothetical protein GRAN_2893 [Granulicella sibirica]|uniref:DUF2147 domain-containing protein n=1 Tax=Granulicella sibirica TaxID=2479048 RepID=A0A4Q0T3C8_9BACT|nr:hypothetical protein GRAN_2893 [Granulicella sibirica]